MEHAPRNKRAFYGSFVPVSTFSAFACAAVIAYGLEASLSAEAMTAWGWRIRSWWLRRWDWWVCTCAGAWRKPGVSRGRRPRQGT